ncbi:hemolymph lipopolysaccharide-binding protein-like [Neodiprion virginianus]|uniref:hemolymph lipopolysaccharide-binding protein-like n=1 Tax=Neodiprion virginianus TaxID=2961670 RepID=UPI001EE6CAD0|nr:hemolymph lipopolysaccharide-binding protein-like [Neodiprion virginianus]
MAGPSKTLVFILFFLGVSWSAKPISVLASVTVPDRTSEQNRITSLPEGYEPILNSSVAYKVYHDKLVSWMEAKRLCESEGARLAVADSQEIYMRLTHQSRRRIHVGVHSLFDKWVSLRDGSVLSDLQWAPGEPSGTYDCVCISTIYGHLQNSDCHNWKIHYACEVPIPQVRV